MIKYQLTDRFAGTVFVTHLGESGDDRLEPIFDNLKPLTLSTIKFELLPTMHSIRINQNATWGYTLTQSELRTIMKHERLRPWNPILIEGIVLEMTPIDPLELAGIHF